MKQRTLLLPLLLFSICVQYAMGQESAVYSVANAPDNIIVYSLPKTLFGVRVSVQKEVHKPGPLAIYTPKYFGDTRAIMSESTTYSLTSASLFTYGVPDEEKRFSVKWKSGSHATYVELSDAGLLLSVNLAEGSSLTLRPTPKVVGPSPEIATPRRAPGMSQEYLAATTVAKKAEIAAREIFSLREDRRNVISGNSEQPFPDGEALKIALGAMDQQEREIMEHFVGYTQHYTHTEGVLVSSFSEEAPVVAFRFSETLGLLPSDDLRGEPVYLHVKVVEKAPLLSEKEALRKSKRLRGIVYNVPGRVEASLVYRGKEISKGSFEVAQIGSLEALGADIFIPRRSRPAATALFDSATGGLRKVSEVTTP